MLPPKFRNPPRTGQNEGEYTAQELKRAVLAVQVEGKPIA